MSNKTDLQANNLVLGTTPTGLLGGLNNVKTALENKGVDVTQAGSNPTFTELTTAINNMPSGSYKRPVDWLAIPTMSGTTDDIYILNGVINNGLNKIYFMISGTGTIDWGDGSTTETFTNVTQQEYSHQYDYSDISSTTWTTHNNSRQVLIHISATRGAITYFDTAINYQYVDANGTTKNYNTNTSTDIYQISANVQSCEVYCSDYGEQSHRYIEIFDWKGAITTTSMSYMFYNCSSLQSIPQLDTSNVTDMADMFANCYSLSEIPQLNTSNVTNIEDMFYYCHSLQTIPQLDTSNVTNMQGMFYYCYSLQSIPQLDTSNVTDMDNMFANCRSLQTIPQLDTGKVTKMSYMFTTCYSLQLIPQLNTSNVTNMQNMFYYCHSLQTIPQLNAGKVTKMSGMLNKCYSLKCVALYNFNPTYTSAITLSDVSESAIMTKQSLVDLFNSLATNSNSYSRTIQLGSTLQGYLANCYVKDSGTYYTAILPTSDTSIQSGKTYYTYDMNTGDYTQVTPDFSTDTLYYEGVTATWNKYVICESTDTGAMLALDYATNIKGYTIT